MPESPGDIHDAAHRQNAQRRGRSRQLVGHHVPPCRRRRRPRRRPRPLLRPRGPRSPRCPRRSVSTTSAGDPVPLEELPRSSIAAGRRESSSPPFVPASGFRMTSIGSLGPPLSARFRNADGGHADSPLPHAFQPPVEPGQADQVAHAEQVRGGHVGQPVMALVDPARADERDQPDEPRDDRPRAGVRSQSVCDEVGQEAIDADVRDRRGRSGSSSRRAARPRPGGPAGDRARPAHQRLDDGRQQRRAPRSRAGTRPRAGSRASHMPRDDDGRDDPALGREARPRRRPA